jgi:Arc/MetJ-type ribon-helix-helix transcriptional regulator
MAGLYGDVECNAIGNAIRYGFLMVQLVTKVDDLLAHAIDALVSEGKFASRSEVVRAGLVRVVEEAHRATTAAAIVAGYKQHAGDPGRTRTGTPGNHFHDRRGAMVRPVTPAQGEIWWAEAEDKRRLCSLSVAPKRGSS